MSMAMRFEWGPTTRPRPLSPSIVVVLIVERTVVIFGLGLMGPSLRMPRWLEGRASMLKTFASTAGMCDLSQSAQTSFVRTQCAVTIYKCDFNCGQNHRPGAERRQGKIGLKVAHSHGKIRDREPER